MMTEVTVVIMLLLFFTSVSTPPSGAVAVKKLELTMTVNKDIVPIGQQIDFTLTLTNIGKKDVTITFGTTQAFDLSYDTTTGRYHWSDGQYFGPLTWEVALRPGENFSEALQWNLYPYDRASGKFLQPELGAYEVWGTCVGMSRARTVSPTTITLVVPGDVNGNGKVNVSDLFDMSKVYGSKLGDSNWNANCDIDGDGIIDSPDLLDLSENYGKTDS